jgi:glyoxylase-like metal-dependent hydrolase (beta-lactamase superfamily II)
MPSQAALKIAQELMPALDHPLRNAPAFGATVEVAPGVHWLPMPLPFPPGHINLWLIADDAGWTVVDSGYGNDRVRQLWDALFERDLGQRAISRLLLTHCHPDHIGNAAWIAQRCDLLPWMTKSEYLLAHAAFHLTSGSTREELLSLNVRHGLPRERIEALQPPAEGFRKGVPELPAAFRRIKDCEVLMIGGNSWHVIVGHGHSPEHAAFYCEALGVLISGDMLLPRISTNVGVWPMEPDADPVGEFLASLERFAELPADTLVLPSHGLPFRGGHTRIDQLVSHHRARLDALQFACAEPRTAAEVLPVLFDRDYDNHQLFFAMGEAIAHLNYLMHRGRLERSPGPVHRFRRKTTAPN